MLAGVLSVVAAFAYTCGLALQQKANLETPTSSAGLAATVRRVVLNRWWLGGFGLGVAGFVVHGVALALGSLTAVQFLQVSQIAFMVPLGAWVAGIPMHSRDAVGAALVGIGLVGFLVALRPSEDAGRGTTAGWIATTLVGALAVGGLLALVALSTITLSTPVASTIIAVAVFGEDLDISQLTMLSELSPQQWPSSAS